MSLSLSCSLCNETFSSPSSLSSAHPSFSETLCSSCTLKKLLVLLRRGNVVCDCCGKFYRPNRRREMSRFFCYTCETSFNRLSREELKADINQICPYKRIKRDSATKEDDNCCLCLETYNPGEYKRVLTCGHIFHKKCIDQWFLKDKTELEDCTCPLCRAPLATKKQKISSESEDRLPSVAHILNQTSEPPANNFSILTLSEMGSFSPAQDFPPLHFYLRRSISSNDGASSSVSASVFSPTLPPITTTPSFVFTAGHQD